MGVGGFGGQVEGSNKKGGGDTLEYGLKNDKQERGEQVKKKLNK